RPEGEENKYNAWYYKAEVKGAPTGKLAGKSVALKDNVCLAGVPMMNGASTLEGYVPDVDATIVTRIPAAYCGIYGMKPTHGLVPYTGIMPIENTLDHTGPMSATVADNALLLEVLAGPAGLDPRQIGVKTAAYTKALTADESGLRIGVLKEGFGHAVSEPVVDGLVRKGADRFKELGATVEEVSVPMHLVGPAIWTPIAVEGATWQMM